MININETAVTIAAARVNVSSSIAYGWVLDAVQGKPKPLPDTVMARVLDCYCSAVAGIESCQEQTRPFLAALLHDDDGFV